MAPPPADAFVENAETELFTNTQLWMAIEKRGGRVSERDGTATYNQTDARYDAATATAPPDATHPIPVHVALPKLKRTDTNEI